MTTCNGLPLACTAFNKPQTIKRGTSLIIVLYDLENQRYKQMSMEAPR
jgi:hypothetical protein